MIFFPKQFRLWTLSIATILSCPFSVLAAPTVITVGMDGDTAVMGGGSFVMGNPSMTDLRGALNQVNIVQGGMSPNPDGFIINFDVSTFSSPLNLAAPLPILNLFNFPLTIDGGTGSAIAIDGGGTFRGFFVSRNSATLKNFVIENVRATGGTGGASGGGGGMGAGAGLFVQGGATAILSNVLIQNATSTGGNGGAAGVPLDGLGGGGGMGGNGGNGGAGIGPGGGGGLGGNGGNGTIIGGGGGGGGINSGSGHLGEGGSGGAGGQGGGIGGAKAGDTSMNSGGAFGGGGASQSASFGAGGGIGGGNGALGSPGAGGFGGGSGGGGSIGGYGGGGGGLGSGGFGGGGGGDAPGGFGGGGGGAAAGGVGGGAGNPMNGNSQGGGGFGAGGAIFVDDGATLRFEETGGTGSGNSVVAGTGYNGSSWAAGNDAFFVTGAHIVFDPNGGNITISNSIADDSEASFVGAPADVHKGSAAGATITIGDIASAPGLVHFPSTNQSTYSGLTSVNKGTFRMDGSLQSPVSVSNGARLNGTGIINNSVTINANSIIHAGNSIGTLTMNQLTLTSSSSILELEIELNSQTSSIFQVNGPVSLNGAILQIFPVGVFSPGAHTYNFLTSTGTISGQFGLIADAPLGTIGKLNYFPGLVQLILLPITVIGQGVTLSHNERATLNYMFHISFNPALQPIFQNLSHLTPDQLRAALDSISPARNAAATYFTNQVAFAVGKISLDRMTAGRIWRQWGTGPSILGSVLKEKNEALSAMNETADCTEDSAVSKRFRIAQHGKPYGHSRTATSQPENYSVWGTGFGDFISQKGRNSNPRIHDTAAGVVVGSDYYGVQNGIFSLSVGYLHNDISEKRNFGSGTSNGATLGLFGTGMICDGYVEGGVLGGYNRFNMVRNVIIEGPDPFFAKASSSFNNWLVMPHLGGGYDWMMSWGVVEPFARLDWAVSFQESYSEQGAAPLNMHIHSQTPSILRSEVGLNVYETWDNEQHACIFAQSVSYINKSIFSANMQSALIFAPSSAPAGAPSSFTLWTYDRVLNLGGVDLDLFYKHKKTGFFLSGHYHGEFGGAYLSNEVTGTLGAFF